MAFQTDTFQNDTFQVDAGQVVVAQFINPNTLLYDPTVTPGGVVVEAQLLSNASQLFTPDNVALAQSVVSQLLSNAISVNDHTISPGAVDVVAQLLTNGVSVNDPTITAVSTVVAQLLVQNVLVNDPAISQQVVTNLINNGSSVYDPTITAISNIVAQLLSNPAVVNEHTIVSAGFVVAQLLANGTSAFNLKVDQSVTVPLLATSGAVGDMPVFQNSGAGVAGGNNTGIPYPSSISAGNILVIVAQFTVPAPTWSGWDRLLLDTYSGQHESRDFAIYAKEATGSESGSFDSGSFGGLLWAQMHRFTDATIASLFEDTGWSEGSNTQIGHQAITSQGPNRLAVVFAAHQGDSTADFGELTGESGGDWTKQTFYSNGLSFNGSLAMYTAPLSAAGTISGGLTSGSWYWGSWAAAMKPVIQEGAELFDPKIIAVVSNLLLNSGSNTYDPTVVAVSQVLAQLLSNAVSVDNPDVAFGSTVAVDSLPNDPVAYDPTAIIEQFVEAQLIANGSSIYDPTVSSASTVVAVLLSNGHTLYQPTVQATNEILAQLISNGHSLYSPSVSAVSLILAQLLDNPPITYNSTIAATNTIVSLLIQNPESLFDPEVVVGGVTVAGLLLVNAISVPDPAANSGGVFIQVQALSNPTTADDPTVDAQSVVEAQLLNSPPAAYDPSTAAQVSAQFVPDQTQVDDPSTSIEVEADHIASQATGYDPSALSAYLVEANSIGAQTTLYQSDVTSGTTVFVPLLEITPLVNDPTIIPGGVSISPDVLSQLIAAYNPEVSDPVAPGQTVETDTLDATGTAPSPDILAGMVTVQANLLDQSPSLYAPGITQEQFVTAQIIAQAIEAHSPSLSSIYTVIADSLIDPISIFTPESIPGGVVVQAGELILIAQIGNPRVFVGIVPTNFQWDSQADFSSTDDDSMPTGQDDLRRTH